MDRPIYHKNAIIILPYNNCISATETWHIRYESSVLSITWILLLVKICKLLDYLVSQTFMIYQRHLIDKNILNILLLSASLSRPWASQKTLFCVLFIYVILSPRNCLAYLFYKTKIRWEMIWKNQKLFFSSKTMAWLYIYLIFFSFTFILIALLFIFNVFNILNYVCEINFLSAD